MYKKLINDINDNNNSIPTNYWFAKVFYSGETRLPLRAYIYDTQYGTGTGTEFLASKNSDGTFNAIVTAVKPVDGKLNITAKDVKSFENVPFIGEFNDYRDMDVYAASIENPFFVCHVAHNKGNEFVLFADGESYYITLN